MINRELIRIKIVQLVYAYYQNGSKNIDSAERELFFSLEKAYDLYNILLSLIPAITREAQKHLEIAQSIARREQAEEPSAKFAMNRFALQVTDNKMLNTFMEKQEHTWRDEPEFIKKLYDLIVASETYQNYMASKEDSYEDDREVWRKLYRTLIQDNADLDALLEEWSLYWNEIGRAHV